MIEVIINPPLPGESEVPYPKYRCQKCWHVGEVVIRYSNGPPRTSTAHCGKCGGEWEVK